LGDRIRMGDHHADPGVFIRSTASRGRMGGIAESTLELALLLDAAGYKTVLVETVGVGQDEIEIARLADVTVLVLVPGTGDDVQAIKAGIMEIADVFALNKADLPGAERLEAEIRAMQSLASAADHSDAAPVRRIVASEGKGVGELIEVIKRVFDVRGKNRRTDLWMFRLYGMLRDRFLAALPENELRRHAALVAERKEDPYNAMEQLTAVLLNSPQVQNERRN